MKTCFSNATVYWNEQEILRRESYIREIPAQLLAVWQELNPAVKMRRVETPILTPERYLSSHISSGFNLIPAGAGTFLRPETTVGTYEAFDLDFPDKNAIKKHLPMCYWQVGCSFREEANPETMRASRLRLRQFYQMEFQLFCSVGTMAPYIEEALKSLIRTFGGEVEIASELPHYSEKTIDWIINGMEVAGCSIRKDWKHGMVFEVAIGLDRLVALSFQQNTQHK